MTTNFLKKLVFILLIGWLSTAFAGTVTSYISAPGVQVSPGGTSFINESFDSLSTGSLPSSGTLAVGTYVNTASTIGVANDYGGACSTATTSDNQSTACAGGTRTKFLTANLTITLNTPSVYVGFWWSAGSPSNTVEFLDQNDRTLLTYTTDTLFTLLSGSSVTTTTGGSYQSADYRGNPTTTSPRLATPEPFTYLHLLLDGTTSRIAKIRFSGGGFELDNLTTSDTLPAIDNSWVRVNQLTTSEPATVGGTLTGLTSGRSVTLKNNAGNDLTLSADGSFTFSNSILAGSAYAVTVGTQPTGQTCTVTNGTGTASANVSNVTVTCTTNTYTVGGSVTGLASGQSLVLLNNSGNSTTVSSNTSFTFSTAINSGSTYAVTVGTQPTGQTCTVTNGSGNVSANVTNVSVSCVTNTYTVGGSVTGLAAGQSVVLLNNAGNSTTVNSNTSFTFSTAINSGGAYAVTVGTQPTGQTCTVTNGSGNVSANVTNVTLTCTDNPVQPIPTLGEWAMIFMASLMAMFGIRRMRRTK
jgi:hypothetical protein